MKLFKQIMNSKAVLFDGQPVKPIQLDDDAILFEYTYENGETMEAEVSAEALEEASFDGKVITVEAIFSPNDMCLNEDVTIELLK